MAEQLLPVTLWDSEYIIHPSDFGLNSSHSAGFILRIVTYKRPVHLLVRQKFAVQNIFLPSNISDFFSILDVKMTT